MRRSAVVAVVGGAAAVAGAAYVGLVAADVVTDTQVAGTTLKRLAAGAVVIGIGLVVGGLIFNRRQQRADAAALAAEELELEEAEAAYVWPTIVVRRHGKPRRPKARVVTLPPPSPPTPSPHHPSVTNISVRSTPTLPAPTVGDGWLSDNVQRLPYRP